MTCPVFALVVLTKKVMISIIPCFLCMIKWKVLVIPETIQSRGSQTHSGHVPLKFLMTKRLSKIKVHWPMSTQWYFKIVSDVPESFLSSQSRKHFESDASKSFSSLGWIESQELSSHFEPLVCELESMSSKITFNIFPVIFYYKLVLNELQNGTHRPKILCSTSSAVSADYKGPPNGNF